MSKYLVNESTLYDIACAIRSKCGKNDPIKVCEFADEIEAIQAGALGPIAYEVSSVDELPTNAVDGSMAIVEGDSIKGFWSPKNSKVTPINKPFEEGLESVYVPFLYQYVYDFDEEVSDELANHATVFTFIGDNTLVEEIAFANSIIYYPDLVCAENSLYFNEEGGWNRLMEITFLEDTDDIVFKEWVKANFDRHSGGYSLYTHENGEWVYLGEVGGSGGSGEAVPDPILIEKVITESGTYNASDEGADGFSSVIVDIKSEENEWKKLKDTLTFPEGLVDLDDEVVYNLEFEFTMKTLEEAGGITVTGKGDSFVFECMGSSDYVMMTFAFNITECDEPSLPLPFALPLYVGDDRFSGLDGAPSIKVIKCEDPKAKAWLEANTINESETAEDSPIPIEVSTEEEMISIIENGLVGGVYKFTGSSDNYLTNEHYMLTEGDSGKVFKGLRIYNNSEIVGTWTFNETITKPSSSGFLKFFIGYSGVCEFDGIMLQNTGTESYMYARAQHFTGSVSDGSPGYYHLTLYDFETNKWNVNTRKITILEDNGGDVLFKNWLKANARKES